MKKAITCLIIIINIFANYSFCMATVKYDLINIDYIIRYGRSNTTIEFLETQATLKNIMLNGKTIEGFDPLKNEYVIKLPSGTVDVPGVRVLAYDEAASVLIVPTESLPGKTAIQVTSRDEIKSNIYTINFIITGYPLSMKSYSAISLKQEGSVEGGNIQYKNAEEVIEALPKSIGVMLEDNETEVNIPVVWYDADNYNAWVPADYTFASTWGELPSGVDNDDFLSPPTVEVKVPEILFVANINQNNILLIGDYAFDLNEGHENMGHIFNNFIIAAKTAYKPISIDDEKQQLYQIYYRYNNEWYDIILDYEMNNPIKNINTINGNGTYKYMNMK